MFHAAQERMRPMLMTALSACIALLPAALSTGIGSQVQRPLAAVVVGGMLIGPVMLLVVVPPLRMIFLGSERDSQSGKPFRRSRRDAGGVNSRGDGSKGGAYETRTSSGHQLDGLRPADT